MSDAPKEMRAVYNETLMELAAVNPNIVVVEADLMRATGTIPFMKAFPDRAINVGVAEANLVGVASGLSSTGKIPFAATFACFASRRAYDQFFLSSNYAKLNVKLVGTDPGVMAVFNGGTHMPFEDLALMRVIPDLTIVEPSDPVSLKAFIKLAAARYGCVYLRMPRKPAPSFYPADESFEFGKAKLLREGKDVVLVALGALMVAEALKAADLLKVKGVSAAVIDVLTLKPLDGALIGTWAKKCGKVVTMENHQAIGGLGSAVAEYLMENGIAVKFARQGVKDLFGEVGTLDYLQARFQLTAADTVRIVESL